MTHAHPFSGPYDDLIRRTAWGLGVSVDRYRWTIYWLLY